MGRRLSGFVGAKRAARKAPPKTVQSSIWTSVAAYRLLWISLLLTAVTIIVYAPVWNYPFASFDDPVYISRNPHVYQGLTWESCKWALTTGYAASWHPLTWLSHMALVEFCGMEPGRHHLFNLFLHCAGVLLLFWLLYRMTGRWGPSSFVAALFAVHPLHVESVAWISERKDVLSALFWMLTIHAYLNYVRRPAFLRYMAIVVFFALGLMSKPMLITLPFVLILLDVWPLNRAELVPEQAKVWLRLAKEKVPLFLMALAAAAVSFAVQLRGGTVQDLGSVSLGARLGNAVVSYCAYIEKMIFPTGLSVHYPFFPVKTEWCVAGILALSLVSFLVLRFRRSHPYLLSGWLWFLLTLVPVIGLIQVGGKARADRFTYIPLIGIYIMAAWGTAALCKRMRRRTLLLPVAALTVICALAATARHQVGFWENDLALWQHTLESTGNNAAAHTQLGFAFLDRGQSEQAEAHYNRALLIDPEMAETHNALGLLLFKQGRRNEAEVHYKEAIRIKPGFADPHTNMGIILVSRREITKALDEFRTAIRLNPEIPEFHYNLGHTLASQGPSAEAAAELRQALALNPAYPEAHNRLGNLLLTQGNSAEAMEEYFKALQYKPDFADAHNNLGVALMNHGKSVEAISHFKSALEIVPGRMDVINNLGLALMDCRHDREAAACFAEVLQMDPNNQEAKQNLQLALSREKESPIRRPQL